MASVKTMPFVLVATLALTAAKHAPPVTPIATPAAAATVKGGVERWRAGDYAAAVAAWTPFAAAGDADALFNLGQAYKLGRGVTADAATARDYYRKAATKGHLPAQANLGIALFQAGEKPEAIKWLRTAADRGEARAQYVLGIAAINGDGVPRSQSLGYGYLLRAQASGLPQAVTALGTIAPALSPADRIAGEAVAASLATGIGVPVALAATMPRLIPAIPPPRATASLPVVTPPAGSMPSRLPVVTSPIAAASITGPASAASVRAPTQPASAALAVAGAVQARTPAVAPPAGQTPDKSLPPVLKPAAAVPQREPTPTQADAAARLAAASAAGTRAAVREPNASERRSDPVIATVPIPASRPVAPTAQGRSIAPVPQATASADPSPPKPPSKAPADASKGSEHVRDLSAPSAAAAKPLKPFETVAQPVPPKSAGWRVQLGAFSSRKLADAAWADVRDAAAPAKPVFAADGPVTKLQMGPFASHDAAKAACKKLTAAGRACFVTQG